MPEKSISEQIIDEFIEGIGKAEILDKKRIDSLKAVLDSDKPKKADILKALEGPQ